MKELEHLAGRGISAESLGQPAYLQAGMNLDLVPGSHFPMLLCHQQVIVWHLKAMLHSTQKKNTNLCCAGQSPVASSRLQQFARVVTPLILVGLD